MIEINEKKQNKTKYRNKEKQNKTKQNKKTNKQKKKEKKTPRCNKWYTARQGKWIF